MTELQLLLLFFQCQAFWKCVCVYEPSAFAAAVQYFVLLTAGGHDFEQPRAGLEPAWCVEQKKKNKSSFALSFFFGHIFHCNMHLLCFTTIYWPDKIEYCWIMVNLTHYVGSAPCYLPLSWSVASYSWAKTAVLHSCERIACMHVSMQCCNTAWARRALSLLYSDTCRENASNSNSFRPLAAFSAMGWIKHNILYWLMAMVPNHLLSREKWSNRDLLYNYLQVMYLWSSIYASDV